MAGLPAQWLNYPTPSIPRTTDGKPNLAAPAPKTADGKSDLSGMWNRTKTEGGISQLKPSEIKPWAFKPVKKREETLLRDSPLIHCSPGGPIVPEGLTKVVQTPALIIILNDDLTYR